MSEKSDAIVAAGAEIIWVLEADQTLTPGTAKSCMDVMDQLGNPSVGWCVGDDQTQPESGTFDDSPFSEFRGFDMIVPRSTMTVDWVTNHGTPSGNENLDGDDVLAAVRQVVDGL